MFRDVPRSWFYRRPRKTDKASVHALRSVHTRRQVAPTCRDDTSQRQIASCVMKNFCENLCLCNRILSQRHVAKKSNQTEFGLLVAATKFCCTDTKRFVAAMCRRNMLLQIVAGPVHTE